MTTGNRPPTIPPDQECRAVAVRAAAWVTLAAGLFAVPFARPAAWVVWAVAAGLFADGLLRVARP